MNVCPKVFVFLFTLTVTPACFAGDSDNLYGKLVHEIRIHGARYTETEIITRELASKVGKPYTRARASKDFNRLDKLDIFSKIEIVAKARGDGVVLDIFVKEIFPYLPFLSYEVTDQSGLSVGPGFQSVNFLGRDIFLLASLRTGGATNIEFTYEDPWITGNHLSVRFDFLQRNRFNALDHFNEIATELYLQLGSYLGDYGRIGGRLAFISVKSDSPGVTLSPDGRDNVPRLGFYLGFDSRDLWADPHRGWWNEVEVAKSGGFLGGDGDYWTLNLDVRRYVPIIPRHTLALFSLTTFSFGKLGTDIPVHLDYHIGGTNSVRGWDISAERSGKHQWLATAEYRVTLLRPRLLELFGLSADIGLQFALFGDLGLAWNTAGQFDPDNVIGGYGFGLRLLLPTVNMVRFDLGLGEAGQGLIVHIGALEKPVAQRFRVR